MLIVDSEEFYEHPIFNNYLASKNGNIYSLKSKKILSKKKNNGYGYLIFYLYDEKKNYYQHRFVYEVFNGLIPKGKQVDHINNLRNDNKIENLQLLTPQQNNAKSNNKPIISTNIKTGEERRFKSIKIAGAELDICSNNISNICKNKNKTAKSKKDGYKYTFNYLI